MRHLSVCLLVLCVAASASAQLNSCANAYWANTLRCKAFPFQAPQPNLGSAPANAGEVKTFARVFLNADPAVRCLDGTRPVIYVDKAVGVDPSNNWVISVLGGGSAAAEDSDGDGDVDEAQAIVDDYANPLERDEMGTATEPAMKELNGINDPDPIRNNVFAGYNRVRIEKCSYDRFQGRAAYIGAGAPYFSETLPGGGAVNFNLWQQGYLLFQETFDALDSGLTYTTWSVDPNGAVVAAQETLEPLANAEKILITGHSGGAHGLYHNIDNLAAELAAIAPAADVRVLFDANFLPSNENEVSFDLNAPAGSDAYSDLWYGESVATNGTFFYDGAAYWPAGYFTKQYQAWEAELDASCLAAHPAPDDWRCNDRYHVLFNHIATPFMIRQDFSDPNLEHTNGGAGHTVSWGHMPGYLQCPAPPSACYPVLTPAEYRERIAQQFETWLDESPTRSEMALGIDPSLGAGNVPAMAAWMPDCGVHEGANADVPFFDTTMTYLTFTHSMMLWTRDFMSIARTNQRSWDVDGWVDSVGNAQSTTTCN